MVFGGPGYLIPTLGIELILEQDITIIIIEATLITSFYRINAQAVPYMGMYVCPKKNKNPMIG